MGLVAGLGSVALWRIAAAVLPLARRLELDLAEIIGQIPRSEVVALAVLSGVGEELFFRGAMQPSFGLLLTSLLFALAHSGPGRSFMLWSVFALLAGLGLGGLYLWRGNLVSPIVAHFAINAMGLWRLSSWSEESGPPATS